MRNMDEATKNLFDDMSDGQWHPLTKIRQRNLRNFASRDALSRALDEGVRRGVFISGSNSSYRMTRSELEHWRAERDLPISQNSRDTNAPRYFGGILEDDGWLLAPLRQIDVVHFHAGESAAERVKEIIGLNGIVLHNFEGLVRVFAMDGSFAYNMLKDATAEDPNLDISGIRIDRSVKRRELCDLPDTFVYDLCEFYGSFAYALLRQSMSSVRKHIADRDDVQQQIYLWIIDAIQRYDEQTSIPFAAYLHSAINRWVHDLSRKSFGRAVADSELQLSRARASFQTEHNRKPTLEELAEVLGESVEKVRKKEQGVQSVNSLRTAAPLVVDDRELPIVADEDPTARVHEEAGQTLLSVALTTSALNAPGGPSVTAWCNIYAKTWGEGVEERLTAVEKTAERAVMGRMQEALADLR